MQNPQASYGLQADDLFTREHIQIQSTEIHKAIAATQDNMFKRGISDGALGVPTTDKYKENLASIHSDQLYADAMVILEGLTDKSNYKKDEQEKKKKQAYTEVQNQQKHIEVLLHAKRQDPRSYSSTMVRIYIVVGLMLFFADLPLAYKLIEQGFNLDRGWEIFITAIGVACCTIFIKIMYDEFVGPAFGHPVIAEKYFFRLFGEEHESPTALTEEEIKTIHRWKKRRTDSKFGILALTLIMIIILGFFRAITIEKIESAKEIEAIIAEAPQQGGGILSTLTEKNSLQSTINAANEKKKSAEEKQKKINSVTFIFLTLLFPIISGICFSMGFSYRQNIKAYLEALTILEDYREKYRNIDEAYEETLTVAGSVRMAMKQLNAIDWIHQFSKKLVVVYEYGYLQGHARPELVHKLPDLLTIVENWRDKNIYFKTA